MPVYEYECMKCGHRMEVLQKISDTPLEECEACNGRIKKLISQSTFHLKGTGWYVTDYSPRNRTSEAKKDKSADSKETAPETKKDTGAKTAKDSPGTAPKTKKAE